MAQGQDSDSKESAGNIGGTKAPLSGMALVMVFVVLVAFTAFVWYMITQRADSETTWSRLAWLFSSVEAIALGAAGALFGSNLLRQRAEKAEAAAERNPDAAAKGRALTASIKADDLGDRAAKGGLESLGAAGQTGRAASDVAARHAAITQELFP